MLVEYNGGGVFDCPCQALQLISTRICRHLSNHYSGSWMLNRFRLGQRFVDLLALSVFQQMQLPLLFLVPGSPSRQCC